MSVKEVLEFVDGNSMAITAVTNKINSIIKEFDFKSKISVTLTIEHPSDTANFKSSTSVVTVDSLTEKTDSSLIVSSIKTGLCILKRSYGNLIPNLLYKAGDTYVANVPVSTDFSSRYYSVEFSFWLPDGKGKDICKQILNSTMEIWMLYILADKTVH